MNKTLKSHKAVVLSNNKEFAQKGKITYIPIYFVMFF